ncbi:MAG: HNH endonuclease [Hydrococcus sp. Prado102]|jgi:putative restriction endonuclease|nr:HNH endonuclease [Hydrococcus sp. Prado102]
MSNNLKNKSNNQADGKRSLAEYCERFAELNVSSNKQRGTAQYKPILLLSVIDSIAQGFILDNKIAVSEDLIDTFNRYWKLLNSEYEGGLHYPFLHLQSEGFWHITFKPEFNGLQPKTTNKLKQAVDYASLDNELFELIQNPVSRQALVDTLIAVWFSYSKKQIEDVISINNKLQSSKDESNISYSKDSSQEKRFYFKKSILRNAFFRKAVVHVYDYKCAFCKLKVTRSLKQNIVDGAHIKPLAQFYDNRIDNGISFCKNHHWAFDNGLFTIDNEYKIIVSNDFQEESPHSRTIREFHGEAILLPNSTEYLPRVEALQWHRKNVFRNK